MNGESFNILKLKNEDKSLTYRVKPEWKDDSFNITVFLEDSTAWHADVTKEQLIKLAEERSQDVNEYYNTIMHYFNKSESNVFFEIKPNTADKETVDFIVKRKVSSRTILYFITKLIQVNFQDNLFNFLDELESKHALLYENMKNIKGKIAELEEDKKLCQDKLTEFVNLKTNWEQEMYSNFVIVLNEKKKRIKFLTDLLSRKDIDPDAVQENETNTVISQRPSQIAKRKLETISDSDSNSDYETDNEHNIADDDDVDIEMEPTPSTSKQSLHIDEDSPSQVISLPKFPKKGKQKFVPRRIAPVLEPTHKFLTEETETFEDIPTQEPFLTTQERIDRM